MLYDLVGNNWMGGDGQQEMNAISRRAQKVSQSLRCVLDRNTMKKINTRAYDDITLINGPTAYIDRSGSAASTGLVEAYFLAKDGNDMFYFDANGVEYRVK